MIKRIFYQKVLPNSSDYPTFERELAAESRLAEDVDRLADSLVEVLQTQGLLEVDH